MAAALSALAARLVQAAVVLTALSAVLFALLSAMPGDALEMMLAANPEVRPQDLARLRRLRGLDQPWHVQYVRWLWGHPQALQPPAQRPAVRLSATATQPWQVDLGAHLAEGSAVVAGGHPAVLDGRRLSGTCATSCAVVLEVRNAPLLAGALVVEVWVDDGPPVWGGVETQVVPHGSPVALPLTPPPGSVVTLLHGPGEVGGDGSVWRHTFAGPGQDVVVLNAALPNGQTGVHVLVVDHGLVPDPARFEPGFLLGNMGFSHTYKRPVAEMVSGRLVATLQLVLPALLLSLLLAIPLGVLASVNARRRVDRLVSGVAFVGMSIPVFWLGLLSITLFAVRLGWLPPGGMVTPGDESVWDRLAHAVLPVGVLAAVYTGRWLRFVRAGMLEVLGEPYVRAARAHGLSEAAVLFRHALPNALLPLIQAVALSLPALVGGAVLTETVFSWPGMGRLIFESVMNADHYVAMVAFLAVAALVQISSMVADALMLWADPRLRGHKW